MKENTEIEEQNFEDQQEPAHNLVPDRDVLMMEKPMQDNRASRFRPADKKRLRNMIVVLIFVIAILITLMVVIRSGEVEPAPQTPAPSETTIRTGSD